MNGFGKDFEARTFTGIAFHSCTIEGAIDILEFLKEDREICFSTREGSSKLFGRECVLVFSFKEKEGEYTPFDADAGRMYGWDEFRTTLTKKELEESFIGIIVSEKADEKIKKAETVEETDGLSDYDREMMENIYHYLYEKPSYDMMGASYRVSTKKFYNF